MFKLFGILLLGLAAWQFRATYQTFHQVRTAGNAQTSTFIGLGLGYGLFFGLLLLVMGIGILAEFF